MFGEKIKKCRTELGLTQQEFSNKLGISRSYLCDIEKDRRTNINVDVLSKISNITGKPIDYFLDKDAHLESMSTLNAALELIVKNNACDDEGNIKDVGLKNLIEQIIKQELKLKIERYKKAEN